MTDTKGKLYLVSTPIGNYDDITLRALNTLKESDLIICEEFREARRLLSRYKIEKELYSINEHNEKENSQEIVNLLLKGKNLSLISDCGTPLFSDPGNTLVELCISAGIQIVAIPGTNSLLPALITSGFKLESFYYYGWLSPKKEIRKQQLLKLKNLNEIIVIMETPYRLKALLTDIVKYLGDYKPISIAYNLTLNDEKIFRGTAKELLDLVEKQNIKGEFVLILNNKKSH